MQTKIKINYWLIAAVAAVAFLGILFLRGCYKPEKLLPVKVVEVDTAQVTALKERVKQAEHEKAKALRAKDSIGVILAQTQGDSRKWAAKYQESKQRKDTVLSFAACDSMAVVIDILNDEVDDYRRAYDAVLDAHDKQARHNDSIAGLQASFVAQYKGLYTLAVEDRNRIAVQLNKANAKTKRERTLTRIAAIIAISAISYAAVK